MLAGSVGEGKEEERGRGALDRAGVGGEGEVVWDGDKGRIEIGKADVFFVVAGTEVVLGDGVEVVVLYRAFVVV